jgi:2-polyprenyl-3-methyl-5-hydroxy-6-metoxy-1,4-benzoquinol methylase
LRKSLLKILRAPNNAESLTLYIFESQKSAAGEEEDVTEGILLSDISHKAYPVIAGVPIMLDSMFTKEFLNKHFATIAQNENLSKLNLTAQSNFHWSYSSEWEEHFNSHLNRTWGWTVEGRVRQLLIEADVQPNWCRGKLILDAGCGNGQLSEGLTELGATVVALDYATSVITAEKFRKSPDLHFIQGDLQTPPFDKNTFDLVISNGVLHRTPDTYSTFVEVSKLVKYEGRFYLWLSRKSEKFFKRYFLYPTWELAQRIVSRLPNGFQKLIVKAYALGLLGLHRMFGKYEDVSWPERVVGAYDALTPLWKHYHRPLEVCFWFFLNGFSCATITHWDNPYGFGMVAIKRPQTDVAGVNFGKAGTLKRHWE